MDNFYLTINNPFSPAWIIYFIALGVYVTISIIVTIVIAHKSDYDAAENVGYTLLLSFFILIFAGGIPAAVIGSTLEQNQDNRVLTALRDRGYDHVVSTDSATTFTASKEGKYIHGDIIKKSNARYLIVIEK